MQWEYYRLTTVDAGLDDALHELGLEGWELVSILHEDRLFHGFQCLLKHQLAVTEPTRTNHPPIPHRFNKYLGVR